MASSQSLQDRCKTIKTNGAIYLESILRNVDIQTFSACWGLSIDIGVFAYLKSSMDGLSWLSKTWSESSRFPIDIEYHYWLDSNITEYVTQWRNYKSLGVTESFSIQNAFGFRYPMTLKQSNGTYQFSVQTSFKMQMPLASLLTAISSNSSVIRGQSLVRTSPLFAFRNSTPESTLMGEGYLTSPWGQGFASVRSLLGPFGTILTKRVPCPTSLRRLYLNMNHEMAQLLSSSTYVQNAFWPLQSVFTINPRPRAWQGVNLGGGDILCDVALLGTTTMAPGVFFTAAGSCAVNTAEYISADTKLFMIAAMAVNATYNATTLAAMETRSPASTKAALQAYLVFFKKYFATERLSILYKQAQQVKADFLNNYRVSLLQFLRRGSTISLSTLPLFDPSEPEFEYYAWLYLFDWVDGVREVVSFQGENGAITAISTVRPLVEMQSNPAEIPSNVAFLTSWVLQYITLVLLFVVCVVLLYILGLQGQVEALNIVIFSRVDSLVWIGRPLIFVRALTAIGLLSTVSLTLKQPLAGLMAHLEPTPTPWYTVILAAGELNWMDYVIVDVFSVLTKHLDNIICLVISSTADCNS
ncbi:hypothetical protein AeRB84_016360 [Aphanomyces euteiches]|nr:hypothetical protein AeRB84_016360 [Aphanomyces euteiches]